MMISQQGFKVLRKARVSAFAVFACIPTLLWYWHSHPFWLIYGNSLGLSNEYHWIGLDLFKEPKALGNLLIGLAKTEIFFVWTPFGVVIALFVFSLKIPIRAKNLAYIGWPQCFFI